MTSMFLINVLLVVVLVATLIAVMLAYQKKVSSKEVHIRKMKDSHRKGQSKVRVSTQEEERHRMARELHDGVGGTLLTAKLLLQHERSSQDLQNGRLQDVERLLESGIEGIREAAHELMPPALQRLGLQSALQDLRDHVTSGASLIFELNIENGSDSTRLPMATEIAIYRVVQELVKNSITHGKADVLELAMNWDAALADLQYSDNGIGCELPTVSKGLGMQNLLARAESIGAELKINSEPGKGFAVHMTWNAPYEEITP